MGHISKKWCCWPKCAGEGRFWVGTHFGEHYVPNIGGQNKKGQFLQRWRFRSVYISTLFNPGFIFQPFSSKLSRPKTPKISKLSQNFCQNSQIFAKTRKFLLKTQFSGKIIEFLLHKSFGKTGWFSKNSTKFQNSAQNFPKTQFSGNSSCCPCRTIVEKKACSSCQIIRYLDEAIPILKGIECPSHLPWVFRAATWMAICTNTSGCDCSLSTISARPNLSKVTSKNLNFHKNYK